MEICKSNYKFYLNLKGKCDSCSKDFDSRSDKNLEDLIPDGLCPFAYYSIIPYWVSFKQNAWFRWRLNKDDVVCQCPRFQGVIFLVRKSKRLSGIEIEAEVTNVGSSPCPYKHTKGQIFRIQNDVLCPALFPSLWTHMDMFDKNDLNHAEISCVLSSARIAVDVKRQV